MHKHLQWVEVPSFGTTTVPGEVISVVDDEEEVAEKRKEKEDDEGDAEQPKQKKQKSASKSSKKKSAVSRVAQLQAPKFSRIDICVLLCEECTVVRTDLPVVLSSSCPVYLWSCD